MLSVVDARVEVQGDEVLIDGLCERDAELASVVRQAEDPVEAVRSCLSVGARAMRGVQASVDARVIDARFGESERRLDAASKEAVQQIGDAIQGLLSPEGGELRKLVEAFKHDLNTSLGATFDPQSKASAVAKLEEVFAKATAQQARVVRDLVDPNSPDSPLGRLRTEFSKELRDVRDALNKLQAQSMAAEAHADTMDLTAVKGLLFEELVLDAASTFVALYGDVVEAVGSLLGNDGGRVGDFVVTLNQDDTPGEQARYVIEAKDRKKSVKDSLAELDAAMKNRDAKAGVLVFARLAQAPIRAPFKTFGNKFIVVLDKECPDDKPLRLALMWARVAVQRQLKAPNNEVDFGAALACLDRAKRAVTRQSTVAGCHTRAKKQIDAAMREVEELVTEVKDALRDAEAKLLA